MATPTSLLIEKYHFQITRIKRYVEDTYEPNISHYRREHAPKRRYVDSSLTIHDMHQDFLAQADNDCKHISYSSFRRVLKDMNISFTKLGNEQCETCLAQKEHSVHCRAETEDCEDCSSYNKHFERATVARTEYKNDAAESVKRPSKASFFSCDLQKVKMLPEIPGVKTAVFTQRIAAYNESFSRLGESSGRKSVAVIWHQGLMGRNDEDVASAFVRIISQPDMQEYPELVLWLDNCSVQNKNWTLYTTMVGFLSQLRDDTALKTITFKYFEAGHTFMSADSFHALAEKSFKKAVNLYDFNDYECALRTAGITVPMKPDDFKDLKSGLSQSAASRSSRPLLADVYVVQFRNDSQSMFFKKGHNEKEFQEADFLMKKIKRTMNEGVFFSSTRVKTAENSATSRKKDIIERMGPLMPSDRLDFWKNL